MLTALWLEGRGAGELLRWERLRLACFGVLLGAAWQSGAGVGVLVSAALYGAVNLVFLPMLRDDPGSGPAVLAQ